MMGVICKRWRKYFKEPTCDDGASDMVLGTGIKRK